MEGLPWSSLLRLGVMGGTFDPIHLGHLVTAEMARHAHNLDRVLFVPSAQPPHKDPAQVSQARDRLAMSLLATVDHPCFAVSTLEMDRDEPSFTVDTLKELRGRLNPDGGLFFITGADALIEITTWRDPAGLFRLAEFIAATRPGYPLTQYRATLRSLEPVQRERVHRLEVPLLAISSSDIRERVRTARPIRYLVPDGVRNYIERYGLYRDAGEPAGRPSGGTPS